MIEKLISNDENYNLMGYNINEIICLCYTLRCNIQCDHCCFNCGPHRTEKMDLDDAKHIIKSAASSGKRFIEFLGGEPFLDYEELLKLTTYASQAGLDVCVDTNGFWGKTVESAKSKLADLQKCGLKYILVSIDVFHQKHIPVVYPLNVVYAANELEIPISCLFCLSSEEKEDALLINDLKKHIDNIVILDTKPQGRAFHAGVSGIQTCRFLGIQILFNGDTYVCCGISDKNSAMKDTPLYMGNCILEDPEEVLSQKNLYFMQNFFDSNSPMCFKNFLKQEPYKNLLKNKKFSHICELCQELLKNKEISLELMNFNQNI